MYPVCWCSARPIAIPPMCSVYQVSISTPINAVRQPLMYQPIFDHTLAEKAVRLGDAHSTSTKSNPSRKDATKQPIDEKGTLKEATFVQILIRNYTLRIEDMALLGYPFKHGGDKVVYIGHSRNVKQEVPGSVAFTAHDRVCVRCGNIFYTTATEYLTLDMCTYHWGKLRSEIGGYGPLQYQCCGKRRNSIGCSKAKRHVWNGPTDIVYQGFLETQTPYYIPEDGNYGVFALDCEMSYTVAGLEVTKVTLVDTKGNTVYNRYVLPKNEIVDFNSRYSGITEKDFNRSFPIPFERVQLDLLKIINSETVLIGHGLENDLKGLKILHHTVVDTAFTFPHRNGLPYKRSLKQLVKRYLKRDIQCGDRGHCSSEDARACMDLMIHRVCKDFYF